VQHQFDAVVERDRRAITSPPYRSCPDVTLRGAPCEVAERIREAIELCLEVDGAPREAVEFVGTRSPSPREPSPHLIQPFGASA